MAVYETYVYDLSWNVPDLPLLISRRFFLLFNVSRVLSPAIVRKERVSELWIFWMRYRDDIAK